MNKKEIAEKISQEANSVVQQLSSLEGKESKKDGNGPTPQDALEHARLCLERFLNFLVHDDFQPTIKPSQWEDTIDLSLGDILDMTDDEFKKFTEGKDLAALGPIEQIAYAYRTAMVAKLKKILEAEKD